MNLNYAEIKLEDYSPEVIKKYQFPKADELERYMRQEQVYGREEHRSSLRLAQQDFLAVVGSLSIGSLAYVFFNLPAGKVIRDRVRASMSYPKRVLVTGLPFVALSAAFFISRKGIENKHKYRQ